MDKPQIKLITGFILNPSELFAELVEKVAWDERMQSRKTASCGVSYDYSGIDYPQTKMYASLNPICEKIQSHIGFMPNNCLMNYYPNGDSSMGYHSDSSEELLEGTGVAILSLGAKRHIYFKSKKNKDVVCKYLLENGLLLYMDNLVQEKWLHAIPKESDVGGRISLTFRNIIK